MLQTDRKTETARRASQDRTRSQRAKSHEAQESAALALQAILAGGDWAQLPTEGVLSLSHTLGNSALLTLHGLRGTEPETAEGSPSGACEAEPLVWGGGEPPLTESPGFGAFAPIGGTAPLNI